MTRALLIGSLIAGCAQRPALPDASVPCQPFATREGVFPFAPALSGTTAEVRFGVALRDCHGENATLLPAVTAQVLDADNQLVPSAADSALGDTSIDYAAFLPETGAGKSITSHDTLDHGYGEFIVSTVSFMPVKPGPYHVSVDVDPGLGVLQTDVAAAEDRRPAMFQTVATAFACEAFAFTPAETLCLSQGVLHVSTDAGVTDAIVASTFAADGERVWSLHTDAQARSFVQLDTLDAGKVSALASLDLTGREVAANALANAIVLPQGDHVVIASGRIVQALSFDGGLHLEAFVDLPTPTFSGLLWSEQSGLVFSADGDDAGNVDAEVCVLPWFAMQAVCVPGKSLGSDGQVLWSIHDSTVSAWSFAADGGVLQRTATLGPLDLQVTQVGSARGGPYRRELGAAGVELLGLDPSPTVMAFGAPQGSERPTAFGVTAALYWELHPDAGEIAYLTR